MKTNRLSRFAIPYVIWMALFVVAPIIMVVIYAFSSASGGFTLDNFARMGTYTLVFTRSFKLGADCYGNLRAHRLPGLLHDEQGRPPLSAVGHGADYAADVDEFSAADLFMDGYSRKQRPFKSVIPQNRRYCTL